MSVLTSPPPALAPDHVARVIEQLYGLSGKLSTLDSERDQNFRLTEAAGGSWVVKIANAVEDRQALDFHRGQMRAAERGDGEEAGQGALGKSAARLHCGPLLFSFVDSGRYSITSWFLSVNHFCATASTCAGVTACKSPRSVLARSGLP